MISCAKSCQIRKQDERKDAEASDSCKVVQSGDGFQIMFYNKDFEISDICAVVQSVVRSQIRMKEKMQKHLIAVKSCKVPADYEHG